MDMIQTYLKAGFPDQNPSEHINQDCLVNSLIDISQVKGCVDSGADSDCSNFDLINAFLEVNANYIYPIKLLCITSFLYKYFIKFPILFIE